MPSARAQPWSTLASLVFLALAALWLMQEPIGIYYQQTYHDEYPLAALEEYPPWQAGREAWDALNGMVDGAGQGLSLGAAAFTEGINRDFVLSDAFLQRERLARLAEEKRRRCIAIQALQQKKQREQEEQQEQQALQERQQRQQRTRQTRQARPAQQQPTQQGSADSNYLLVEPPRKVLMAGDSMMQAIAPYLLRALKKRYGIEALDLSKQSTGLSYPKAFDWPQTIAHAIDDEPGIRLLLIMLGPNDPWDMPSPTPSGGKFLRFKSPEWEAVYRQRVAGIIRSNAEKGVSTLWIGAPGMRAERLDSQMIWLMKVIQDEVEKQGAVFVDTRHLLPGAEKGWSDSIIADGKSVKVRSGDGVHFSVAGEKFLARQVLDALHLPPPPASTPASASASTATPTPAPAQ